MNFFNNKCVRDLPQSEVVSGFLTTYKDKYASGTLCKGNGQKKLYQRCLWCVHKDKYVFSYGENMLYSLYSLNEVKSMVRKVAREVASWYKSYGKCKSL